MRSGSARHSGIQRRTCHPRTYVRSSRAWDGKILRFLGPNWNAGSPGGRLPPTSLPARTEATPQPGRPGASPTGHPARVSRAGGGGWWSRTPSCTATPTSASSTAPRTRRSWPRRRPGSAWRRSPSPTTTACTAWSASPRRPRALGLPTIFGAELSLGLPAPQDGRRPTRAGEHLLVLARGAGGLRAAVPGDHARRSWPAGRRAAPGGAGAAGRAHGGHWAGADRLPQGRGARRAGRPGADGGRGRAGPARRPFGRDNVASSLTDHGDPLDDGRNDALVRAGRRRRVDRRGHQQRRTTRPRAGAGWPPRWPRSGPGAAWTRWTAGCPPPARAHLRSGAEMAARLARYPGAVERAAELGRPCAFDLQLVAPAAARLPGPAPATPR